MKLTKLITSLFPDLGAMKRLASLLTLGLMLPPIAYCVHPWYKLFTTCAYPKRTLQMQISLSSSC